MAHASPARTVARAMQRQGVTRSGMTRISLLVALASAIWFARGDHHGALVGSAFLVLVLGCDAVRSAMRADRRDALALWLVAMLGRLRECVVYVGLAVGAVAVGIGGAWGWAAGALIALALRDSLLVARTAPDAAPRGAGATRADLLAQRRSEGLFGGAGVPAPRPPGDRGPGRTGGASAPGHERSGPAHAPGRTPGGKGRNGGGGDTPGAPDGSVPPNAPASPVSPAGPAVSGAPGTPASPVSRKTSDVPDAPASPAVPDVSATPDAPVPPNTPGVPADTTAPAGPGSPVSPATSTVPATHLPELARRWLSFTQPVRFLAIGVTTVVWDARVAFVTIVVGCAVAVTSELVGAGDHTGRR